MRLAGSESELREQLARYMALVHSSVMYRFDLAADMKLTVGQAARHKRLHPHRGWPDMFVATPTQIGAGLGIDRAGLFLELKKSGTRIKKRNGEWASEHIAEQAVVLNKLRQQGYAAEFAVGFDNATELIDNYLGRVGDATEF